MEWRESVLDRAAALYSGADLSPSDLGVFVIMVSLADNRGVVGESVTGLASKCHITRQTMAKVLDRLEASCFIARPGSIVIRMGEDMPTEGIVKRRKSKDPHVLLREYAMVAGNGKPLVLYAKQQFALVGAFKAAAKSGAKRDEVSAAIRLAKERGIILDIWAFVRELPSLLVQINSGYTAYVDNGGEDFTAVGESGWE